jgi:hypothetical protein
MRPSGDAPEAGGAAGPSGYLRPGEAVKRRVPGSPHSFLCAGPLPARPVGSEGSGRAGLHRHTATARSGGTQLVGDAYFLATTCPRTIRPS